MKPFSFLQKPSESDRNLFRNLLSEKWTREKVLNGRWTVLRVLEVLLNLFSFCKTRVFFYSVLIKLRTYRSFALEQRKWMVRNVYRKSAFSHDLSCSGDEPSIKADIIVVSIDIMTFQASLERERQISNNRQKNHHYYKTKEIICNNCKRTIKNIVWKI